MSQAPAYDDFPGLLENLKNDRSIQSRRNVLTAISYLQPGEVAPALALVADVLPADPDAVHEEFKTFLADVERKRAGPHKAQEARASNPLGGLESRSDTGNSRRLVALYGDRLRFCHALNRWLIWSGDQWRIDEDAEIYLYARATVQRIYQEAANIGDKQEREAHAKFALRSESEKSLKAMIGLARTEPTITIRRELLDAHQFKLNCANGVLDLESGELLDHEPEMNFSKIIPWVYDLSEEAPRWMQFLDEITGGDVELQNYLQQIAGYCLTASTREQVIFIFWGDGRNGKSTFVKMLLELLGPWAAQTPAETFVQRRGNSGHNDLARLADKRLVAAIETEEGGRLAESLIKTLSGSDRVAARRLYEENFEYEPQFKIILTTNCKPRIRETTLAIWRRIRLVPFNWTIPEDKVDLDLERKLRAEMPGILAWAVKGCFAWLNRGRLDTPGAVKDAVHGYMEEQDPVSRFIADRCETGNPGDTAPARKLYGAFQEWCRQGGEFPFKETRFGKRMVELGYTREHGMAGNFYRGIRLAEMGDV